MDDKNMRHLLCNSMSSVL